MIVSAITVYAVITIFWCITYLIPQNELPNPEYHHGLDTDYKDLKGDALANAKVRDSVAIPTWMQAQVLIHNCQRFSSNIL